jgi:hypothetical protein
MKRSKKATTREKRPFGIWALTVFAIVINGIMPIYGIFLLFLDPFSSGEVVSILTIAFLLIIALGVIITSIGTLLRRNRARKALLVFITLAYVPQVIFSLAFVLFYKDPEASSTAAYQQILRGVVTVAVYIWYFNRARIKRFYGVGIDDEKTSKATKK